MFNSVVECLRWTVTVPFLLGGIMPGLDKRKFVDSFTFPGLDHLLVH